MRTRDSWLKIDTLKNQTPSAVTKTPKYSYAKPNTCLNVERRSSTHRR